MSLGPTDPEGIIEFLLRDGTEPFPSARLIALLTLCAWMRWPDEKEVVVDAQTTAAAMVILHNRKHGRKSRVPLPLERACESIVNRKIYGDYSLAFEDLTTADDLVSFFMHCPESEKPSLGKAYHFISNEGFMSDDFDKAERKQMTRARSSLKAAWKSQAKSLPLLWAATVCEGEGSNIYWYAPDDFNLVEEASDFAKDRMRLFNWFGVALFCQEKMSRLLKATGAKKVNFLAFPTIVKSVVPEIETFDEEQLVILHKYAAPQ